MTSPKTIAVLATLDTKGAEAQHLRETLQQLDPIWDALQEQERITLVHQVVASVRYDHSADSISVTQW